MKCTSEPHQRPKKKKSPNLKACTCLKPSTCCHDSGLSLEQRRKKKEVYTANKRNWSPVLRPVVQPATNDRVKSERRWSPVLRPVVQPTTNDRVKSKKGQLFHFTWTNSQVENCKFRVRSAVPISYLERSSPKGSCHPVESDMSHTLAQTCLIELWCGMHRTCNTHSIKSWSEKKLGLGADPSLSSSN